MTKILMFFIIFINSGIWAVDQAEKVNRKFPFDITDFQTYGIWEAFFILLIIPTAILVFITWILMKKDYLVIFYGHRDLNNCVWTFAGPAGLLLLLLLLFSFIDMDQKLKNWITFLLPALVFLYGYFYLIKYSWAANKNKLWLPYVIFVKTFVGFWIGLGVAVGGIAWTTNLRNLNNNWRTAIWILRALSLIVAAIGLSVAYFLTIYPDEEKESGGFLAPFNLGRTKSQWR